MYKIKSFIEKIKIYTEAFILMIKYKLAVRRVMKLPEAERYAIGKQTYEAAYENFIAADNKYGDNKAASSVYFSNNFPGHAKQVENYIKSKYNDPNNPVCYYEFEEVSKNNYILTVGTQFEDYNVASLFADIMCMRSVFQVNTSYGDFKRLRATTQDIQDIADLADVLKNSLIKLVKTNIK